MPKNSKNKKKPQSKAPKAIKAGEPVFIYTSVCHGVRASKEALVKTPEAEGTLGGWRCGACSRPCKVTRSKNKPESNENMQQVPNPQG